MATLASESQTVTLTVNDVELQVPKGELIVEAVKRLGLEIPIFCYHPRMKPVGMCRMCLVEVGFKQQDGSVKMMPKPQAACTLPASDGMVVVTDSEAVHRDRKGVLEFLLINHPLDCPICDRGGECPLQNNTLFYGPSTSRYVEIKRHLPKAFPLSEYVTLDLERCIQCGRCVRFTEEISGDAELAFRFRSSQMTPSTFRLTEFTSKFSGNTIEICPVGALTSSQFRFRARPWDLQTQPGICTECSNGCAVWVDYRVGRLVRINGRTNEAVNEEWTCDRGKFGHDWYNSEERLSRVLVRRDDKLEEAEWAEAYSGILDAFGRGKSVAALAGPRVANEALFLLQKLFRERFGSNNLDHRFTLHLQRPEERLESLLGVPQVASPIASYEEAPKIFVFGTSLADEEPMLFLRIRKAWFKNGAKVVVAHSAPTDVDSFAQLVLRYNPGTDAALAISLLAACEQAGLCKVPEAARRLLVDFSPENSEATTGVPARRVREAAELVAGSVVATTSSLMSAPRAQDALEALGALAVGSKGVFNCYALGANDQGAEELGVLPDRLPGGKAIPASERGLDTSGILKACASGKVEALWLVDVDPFAAYPDRELVAKALETVPFLVVQGTIRTEAFPYASVVLPMQAPAEQEGTYVNMERRVQRFGPVLRPWGEAKPAWRIFMELALRIEPGVPFFHPEEVMEAISKEAPQFALATYPNLRGEGVLLG